MTTSSFRFIWRTSPSLKEVCFKYTIWSFRLCCSSYFDIHVNSRTFATKKLGWEENIPERCPEVSCWLDDLTNLLQVTILWCVIQSDFNYHSLMKCEFHHFADASAIDYIQYMSYLRIVNPRCYVFCNFILMKSWLAALRRLNQITW